MASSRQLLRTALLAMVATSPAVGAAAVPGKERSADNVEPLAAESDLMVQAAQPPAALGPVGRYSLAAAGDRMVLLDSAAGRSWLLVVGDDGPAWSPIERVEHEAERGAAAPGAQRANLSATPLRARGSDETAAPEVRILAAERTAFSDIPFVSFSCQATNPNNAPVMFVGYRPDSFGPPLQEGQLAPIYVVELKRDGEWKEHSIGWCGTGMDAIELPPGGSGSFSFAVPAEPQWEAVRVGIRWSPSLTVPFEEVPLAGEEPFTTAWTEPFNPSP